MAKTDRKNSKKIFEGYRKHQKLWNGIFIVLFAVIGIGLAIANGTVDWNPQLVIGRYEFTLFHAIMLVVMVVLLGFGIVAIKRDSSEEQQEIYRQERAEAIRLRQEAMAERKQEMQDAYDAMKRRRAARLAERGIAPTAAAAEAVDSVETVEAAETEAAEAEELAGDAIELAGEEGRLTEEAIEAGEDKKQEENS